MKTFNLASAGISALLLILIFAVGFIEVSVLGFKQSATAWELFTGKDGGEGLDIAILVLVAVIVLAVNIILQFIEVSPVTEWAKKFSKQPANIFVNNITAIVCAALLLIVGLVTPGTMKDIVAEKDGEIGMEGLENLLNIEMAAGAWIMVILAGSMLFLPKFIGENFKK
jgi:uncharacterized paraquat-inducible protein A